MTGQLGTPKRPGVAAIRALDWIAGEDGARGLNLGGEQLPFVGRSVVFDDRARWPVAVAFGWCEW